MNTVIRPALPGDVPAIVSVGRTSFTWAFGHLYKEGTLARYLEATYSQAKIARSLAKPTNTYFVAEVDGRVLGFLKLKEDCPSALVTDPGTPWQTQKLYVDPSALRSGIGRQLHAGRGGADADAGRWFDLVGGLPGQRLRNPFLRGFGVPAAGRGIP